MTDDEKVLRQIRAHIAKLPNDDQIVVQCIAATIRAAISVGGDNAHLALALVSGEVAASG